MAYNKPPTYKMSDTKWEKLSIRERGLIHRNEWSKRLNEVKRKKVLTDRQCRLKVENVGKIRNLLHFALNDAPDYTNEDEDNWNDNYILSNVLFRELSLGSKKGLVRVLACIQELQEQLKVKETIYGKIKKCITRLVRRLWSFFRI